MRLPVNWLREYADLDPATTPTELSDALIRVGLEVERVESAADGLSGPIVVGRVLSAEPEPQKNGKTIRWCSVDVGEPASRAASSAARPTSRPAASSSSPCPGRSCPAGSPSPPARPTATSRTG